MPTYQYACTACGNQLEAVQSFSDVALTECPQCEGKLRKLYSGVGIVFKGSGFYRTDSRSTVSAATASEKGADKGTDKGADSKPASTGIEKKSESKPAATPAAAAAS